MSEIPDRLRWKEITEQSEENRAKVEDWRKILDSALQCIRDLKAQMLSAIVVAFSKQFRIYFNEFMKKPVDLSIDDAIDGLMAWMANNLEGAWTTMLTDDFGQFLKRKWSEIVKICAGKWILSSLHTLPWGQFVRICFSAESISPIISKFVV